MIETRFQPCVPAQIVLRVSASIHTQRNRVRPPPTSRWVQIIPMMRTQYRRVCFSYILSTCTHIRHMTELGPTRGHLPAFLIPHTSTSRIQNTPLPPLTLRVFPSPRRNRNWDPNSLDVISVTSSSDSPPPPPLRRSARKSKVHTTQFMAHVLVPSLLPGAQKSDYAPVKQRPVGAIAGRQARERHAQGTILARMS